MINIRDNEKLSILNHSCAHLLAHAVKHLYPDAKFWVGPVIDNGFYYDIDLGNNVIHEEDFPVIEKEMKKISKRSKIIKRIELSKEEALNTFKDDLYKIDLINNFPEDEVISAYRQDDFIDLCRGPHVENTKMIKYFKLLKVSGAYYKGDSKNKVLQRVYGICFENEKDLNDYLAYLEELKERDHRKLGKELGIFMISDLVGKGLPMWLPNGATIRRLLQRYITDKEISLGYQHVVTPSLGSVNLYKTSGHWAHYKDDMFPMMKLDDEEYVLRPMNCPHHMLIYKNSLHSYRELPIKIAEIANDFRYEASGAVCGIERARAFTQNDSHIFCTSSQIKSQFREVIDLILDVYKDFGFKDYQFRLSLRDKNDTEKYFGNDALWEKSESELREVLKDFGVDFYEAEGEAAFYGPKLDVQVKSALGHDVTLSTIQLDYQLPDRFDLTYIDDKGEKVRPVVIHRAILGSLDRFVAFLLEETKGVLPVWLAPVQVSIIPVSAKHHLNYCLSLKERMLKLGIRVDLDIREEKLGYRMRESQTKKIPYIVVIGDKEVETNTINYRMHGSCETNILSIDDFCRLVFEKINNKSF